MLYFKYNLFCIARQLIEFKYGDSIDVALGGGRKNFLPEGQNDPKDPSQQGKRADGRNLVQEWQDKSNDHIYVWNRTQFNNLSPNCSKKVLGRLIDDNNKTSRTRRYLFDEAKQNLNCFSHQPVCYFTLQ